jgi:hypothetical protein
MREHKSPCCGKHVCCGVDCTGVDVGSCRECGADLCSGCATPDSWEYEDRKGRCRTVECMTPEEIAEEKSIREGEAERQEGRR